MRFRVMSKFRKDKCRVFAARVVFTDFVYNGLQSACQILFDLRRDSRPTPSAAKAQGFSVRAIVTLSLAADESHEARRAEPREEWDQSVQKPFLRRATTTRRKKKKEEKTLTRDEMVLSRTSFVETIMCNVSFSGGDGVGRQLPHLGLIWRFQ